MNVYRCIVNMVDSANLPLTQVVKENVSAAEVILLRAIHGDENVHHLVKIRANTIKNSDERYRLDGIYGELAVKRVFGERHNMLPVDIGTVEDADEAENAGDDNPTPTEPPAPKDGKGTLTLKGKAA